MYTPKNFQPQDPEATRAFIRDNGFGILVSQGDGQLFATHIPLLLSQDGTTLTGHVARSNRQWKTFGDTEVMAIFSGPHTYISSSWYDHENVPTWNYVAAHAYGTMRILSDDGLHESLKQLVDKYEQYSEKPVRVENFSENYMKHAAMCIVAFEITITRLEATFKLSQNRDAVNHAAIVQALQQRGDADSLAIAALMKQHGHK